MSKAQYTLASTTDRDDEESPPPTSYRDDPADDPRSGEAAGRRNGSGRGPRRDDPNGSIFDWGSSAGSSYIGDVATEESYASGREDETKRMKVAASAAASAGNREDVPFAPLSLDDDDDDDDDEEEDDRRFGASPTRTRSSRGTRRLYAGGGWGRHGSAKSDMCRPLRRLCLCSRSTAALLGCGSVLLAFGYLGYEAGQPADVQEGGDGERPTTKGEEWMDRIEHPKSNLRWPPVRPPQNGVTFQPQTQKQLLQTSQLIFRTCNERSLSAPDGRASCLSLCGGRLCCFERDAAFGSCVDEPYSYCFAHAACENLLEDFGMTNVANSASAGGAGRLNGEDKSLLGRACDGENVKGLEGMRDCNALCMHHLCCFDVAGCGEGRGREVCEDYGACEVLVGGGSDSGYGGGGSFGGGANGGGANDDGANDDEDAPEVAPTSNSANGHDFTYHDPDLIRSSVSSACAYDPLSSDSSWIPDCHALCADHLCCFSTPGTTSDCRERDMLCGAYDGCKVLVHSSEEVDRDEIKSKYAAHRPEMEGLSDPNFIPDDIREVNEACNGNVLRDSTLRSRCEKACDSRSCCFANGPGNCYILDTAWCDEFQACRVLSE